MTWRSFLMVYLWISLLSGIVSQKLQDFSKALMVIIPVQGCFPVYRLTVSQARKTNQKHWWWFLQYQNVSKVYLLTSGVKQTTKLFQSTMVIFPVPGCFPVYYLTSESSKENQSKSNDGNFSSTRVYPDVPFDSESSKENQSKVPLLSTYSYVKTFEKTKVRVWSHLQLGHLEKQIHRKTITEECFMRNQYFFYKLM